MKNYKSKRRFYLSTVICVSLIVLGCKKSIPLKEETKASGIASSTSAIKDMTVDHIISTSLSKDLNQTDNSLKYSLKLIVNNTKVESLRFLSPSFSLSDDLTDVEHIVHEETDEKKRAQIKCLNKDCSNIDFRLLASDEEKNIVIEHRVLKESESGVFFSTLDFLMDQNVEKNSYLDRKLISFVHLMSDVDTHVRSSHIESTKVLNSKLFDLALRFKFSPSAKHEDFVGIDPEEISKHPRYFTNEIDLRFSSKEFSNNSITGVKNYPNSGVTERWELRGIISNPVVQENGIGLRIVRYRYGKEAAKPGRLDVGIFNSDISSDFWLLITD